jgi:hypothetical protein
VPGGRLTREVLRSDAKPVGALKRGPKTMPKRKSYVGVHVALSAQDFFTRIVLFFKYIIYSLAGLDPNTNQRIPVCG